MEEDPLDRDDFDPIAYINQRFPTGKKCIGGVESVNCCVEESLENLDTFLIGISSQIATVDEELSRAVQSQTISGEQATRVSLLFIGRFFVCY